MHEISDVVVPYPRALQAFPMLRQSLLSRFDECGLSWAFDYRYRQDWSAAEAARGIIWHRWAAKALAEMAAQGENRIEVDVALAILLETLRQADVPIEDVVNVPQREVHDLLWMVKKFAYETEWHISNLVDIEHRLHWTVRYPNPYGGFVERDVSGQLDALFAEGNELDRGIVIDYKTGWWLPPPSEVSEAGFFQQRFYALLVLRNHPTLNSVTLREFYPRYSESREATIWREQIDELEESITALAERFDRCYEEGAWHPSPGKACTYCPRPTACPIFPTAKRSGRIRDNDEAELVAAQVLVAEAAIKQNKEALKAWAAEHGAVPVRDAKANRVFGHREFKRTERPTKEALEQGLATGESLDDLYRETTHTRFDIHIPRPESDEGDDDLLTLLEQSVEAAQERKEHQ